MPLILKCMIIDDSATQRAALVQLVNDHPDLVLVDEFQSGISARSSIKKKAADLIFLDVEMPVVGGFDLLESLENRPQIILVTGSPDYALRAFDHNVTDYLLKPISRERFKESVKRAVTNTAINQESMAEKDFLYVTSNLKKIKIFPHKIKWVEGYGDYIKLITEEESILVLSTMKSFMARLPENRFLRIHKSYIVNLEKIDRFNTGSVEVRGSKIPLSKHRKTELEEALLNHQG